MTSHILFDFFGTLVTYAPYGPDHDFGRSHRLLGGMGGVQEYGEYLALWSATESRFEREADRTGREFSMRDVTAEFLRLALAREPAPAETAAMARAYVADWETCVRYLPGLEEMLAGLRSRYRLAVVSNTDDPDLVPALLEAMGVRPYFDAVLLSVDVGWRKPHPAIFSSALGELGIEPGDAVFVGDSYRPDYLGPTRAGIRSFLIDPDRRTEVPDHARLSSVFDLPSALSADGVLVREGGHLDAGDLPGGQDAGGPADREQPAG
jgi:putative hydrolase of the HAD superfamily